MDITAISDLHGFYPTLPGGDLLIIAGDLTSDDRIPSWKKFYEWLDKQEYRKIVYIAGNHDGFLTHCVPSEDYICDSGTEFEGLKIWGSPWTPEFYDWHFMKKRGDEIDKQWQLIPDDIDILITHGPPYGILDQVKYSSKGEDGHAGCRDLYNHVCRVKPKLHVFGHIHESAGVILLKHEGPNTWCINASHVDEGYKPVNKPVRIKYENSIMSIVDHD